MTRRDDPTTRRGDPMTRRDDRMARRDDPLARRDDPTSHDEVNESEAMNEPTSPASVSQRNDEPEMGNVRTRSGRAVKTPERLMIMSVAKGKNNPSTEVVKGMSHPLTK